MKMIQLKRLLLVCTSAVFLSACGSNVKLDQPPVEDKTSTVVSSNANTGATQSEVKSVDLNASNQDVAGPANVARLIYFDYDSNVIKPEFQSLIEGHARFLKANNARRIAIEGHTDERGGREYNLALGQRRAEAVRRALNLLGVADSQVEAVSFGKEKPVAMGQDETSFAQNRRAEIAYK